MSRIGRAPIAVPSGVEVTIEPELVAVNGPKGALSERIPRDITVAREDDRLVVTRPTDRGEHRALHGLVRTLVANMVIGVTDGYEKRLEIQGVGYRAQLKGRDLELALGFSHPVSIPARALSSRCPRRHGSSSAESQSSRSARSLPRSASSARPSRTRARGSATRARSSPARSASAHEEQTMSVVTKEARRLKRRRRVRAKVSGTAARPRVPSSAPTAASRHS
jgi:hypothetical protein